MTPFSEVTLWSKNFYFSAIAVIITLTLFDFISFILNKRKPAIIASCVAVMAVETVLLWLTFDGFLADIKNYVVRDVSAKFYNMPVALAWFILSVLCVCATLLLVYEIYCKKTKIDTESIKEGVDELPVGLCFYKESGLALLANDMINEISVSLSGQTVMDGINLWGKIRLGDVAEDNVVVTKGENAIIKLKNGDVKSFSRRITETNPNLYEIIAADVTEQYELGQQLSLENAELKKMNARLREYGDQIVDLTTEREILEAKVRIHDELGHSLLAIKKCLSTEVDKDEVAATLERWKRHATLLKSKDREQKESLQKTADMLGVQLFMPLNLPRGDKYREIIDVAARECLTNTVAHAKGDKLFIKSVYAFGGYNVEFTNNGDKPKDEITEGGGLSTLRRIVENGGGTMTVDVFPEFKLTIYLPEN